jgi:hypothetical protein
MPNNRTVRVDVSRNVSIQEVRRQCGDLLTGIYDTSKYPHSILVDEGNENAAQERLSDRGVLSSIKPNKDK